MYSLCEEFYKDIQSQLVLKENSIQLARRIIKELNRTQILRIQENVQLIKKREENAASYFCTLLRPLLKSK